MASDIESEVLTVGRFSSQLLNYRGSEKKIRLIGDTLQNTFDNSSTGSDVAVGIDSASLATNTLQKGSIKGIVYSALKAFFVSRGVGVTNANALALLTIDAAKISGVSPMSVIEDILQKNSKKIQFKNDIIISHNLLREPGNQLGKTNTVNNKKSFQARLIKP